MNHWEQITELGVLQSGWRFTQWMFSLVRGFVLGSTVSYCLLQNKLADGMSTLNCPCGWLCVCSKRLTAEGEKNLNFFHFIYCLLLDLTSQRWNRMSCEQCVYFPMNHTHELHANVASTKQTNLREWIHKWKCKKKKRAISQGDWQRTQKHKSKTSKRT